MNTYFKKLGEAVLAAWKSDNFSLESFPAIASGALEALPPSRHVRMSGLIRDFLMNDEQANQTLSGFGEPEIVVYEHPKFYIQVLFWLDGTTDIHQHEFSGAFHVMAGSSIHSHFVFENVRPVTPHFRVGDLKMQDIEILETGRTMAIRSGKDCIHALFHLDMPSVTVVIRTQHDPGTGPQFTYLPPHVGLDPVYQDALIMRRKQVLDVLEQMSDPAYPETVFEMIAGLDFERGFYILQNAMGYLKELGAWDDLMAAFEQKHGVLGQGIGKTMEESVRRDIIKDLRRSVNDPGDRFFLALLMNVQNPKDFFQIVKSRYPGEDPLEIVLDWMHSLVEPGESGLVVLDAEFPGVESGEELLQAFRGILSGRKPSKLALPIREALLKSCLRVLVK